MKWLIGVVLCSSCVASNSVVCGEDQICPAGDACDETHHLCVLPEQLTSCATEDDGAECPQGHCVDHVCLPTVCGDGIREFGEACDDGNTEDGPKDDTGHLTGLDGCAADCNSDFTCGNGATDVLLGREECDDGNHLDHDGCSSTCLIESPHWLRHVTEPTPIVHPGYAYDSRRDQLVLFGGTTGAVSTIELADTLVWDGVDWTIMDPAVAPSPRVAPAMAYDRARDRTVLFGGATGGGDAPLQDTWEWNGARWEARVAPGPGPRAGAAMAYDPVRKVVVMFGGSALIGGSGSVADTWEWDGATWKQVDDLGVHPAARYLGAFAFDPKRGTLVLTGGNATAGALQDCWTYDGAWHDETASASPPKLTEAGIVWDPASQRLLLIGGFTAPTTASATVYAWNGSAWTSAGTFPAAMLARGGFAIARVAGSIVVGGGHTQTGSVGETWELGAAGTWARTSGAAARHAYGAFDDRNGARSILFAGLSESNVELADTWQLTGTGYALVPTASPGPRSSPQLAWDPVHREAVMLGGFHNGAGTLSDTWSFRTSWTARTAGGSPGPRRNGAFAWDGRELILFGGNQTSTVTNETWKWDGAMWTMLAPATSPSPRSSVAAAYDPLRDELVMFGGANPSGLTLSETWTFDGTTWTAKATGYQPPRQAFASLAYEPARGKLVLIGGPDFANGSEWDGTTWTPVAAPRPPGARSSAQAIASVRGTGILIYGGTRYDPTNPDFDIYDDSRLELRWDGPAGSGELCDGNDPDHDGLKDCADPDCWYVCTPSCPPGVTCDPAAARCGDAICDGPRESCRTCSADCGTCAPVCGDGFCDTGETGCPGDCP